MIPTPPEIHENVFRSGLQTRVAGGDPVCFPAQLYASFDGGRMRATLQPKHNLSYGRSYRVVVTDGITDALENPGHGNIKLPLVQTVTAEFTTKVPRAFDLSAEERFGQRGA